MRALALAIVLLATGCQHTQPLAPEPFGQSGPGKIMIAIEGGVNVPGLYYVDEGATLDNIPSLAEGFYACHACGRSPTRVYVMSRNSPEQRQLYRLSDPERLRQIRLRDGDRVRYPIPHL